MDGKNDFKVKLKYVLLPISCIEIITLFFLLLINQVLLKFHFQNHLLWLTLLFLPFGYIQFRFYRILDYDKYAQLKSYTTLIVLKSFMPTLYLVSVVYHKFHKQEVTNLNEKGGILLFFYLLGLLFFFFVMKKSSINYYHLIRLFPRLKNK